MCPAIAKSITSRRDIPSPRRLNGKSCKRYVSSGEEDEGVASRESANCRKQMDLLAYLFFSRSQRVRGVIGYIQDHDYCAIVIECLISRPDRIERRDQKNANRYLNAFSGTDLP